MRFRNSSTQPPFLNPRHQRRLLMLAGLLILVLVAMRTAAKPETWNWLFVGQKSAGKTAERKTEPVQPSAPLGANEFRANASPRGDAGSQLALSSKTGTPAENAADLSIDPAVFAKVEDGTYSVPFAELNGYYTVLSRVAGVPQKALRELAKKNGPVAFSVLRGDPKTHRGRAITIQGKLGSLKVLPDARPDLGLKTLYEAWIVTPESDNNPYRVVFSELPAGLAPQDRFSDPPPVRATGYFFKVQTYEVTVGDDQSHKAPLLLAKQIQLVNPAESPAGALSLAPYVIGFALLLGAVLAIFMWRFTAGDRQFAESRLQRYDSNRQANPADLKHLETTEDPQEFFRRLSEADSGAPADTGNSR